MLDFRYHALSLVAVFLALGIGIVLGSSLGDTVVSEANRDLARSLRGDLNTARGEASEARAGVGHRERMLESVSRELVGGRLDGRSVAVVSSGNLPANVQSGVREAVRQAGGRLAVVAELDSPPDVADLAGVLGSRFEDLRSDDERLRPMGRRLGRSLVAGGRVARRLADRFPDRFGGRTVRASAVAVYREPGLERSEAVQQVEQGLIEGLRSAGRPVVGVETLDTEPSQISFFEKNRLSSVDNLNSAGGRIALPLVLARVATGNFGFKETATDGPLPGARRP
jgi:hypothetical protein